MAITFTILIIAVVFFVWGIVRSDLVALCALLVLVLCKILTPEEALSGFSNSIVVMMVGVFVVGGGLFHTGLAEIISRKLLALAGTNETKLFLLIMGATSVIGAFISNTGTVAVMLPIIVSMAHAAKISPSRFLMPLAFASSMGGMLTLIGTPPNLVVNQALIDAGYAGLSFFSFTPVGIVCVLLGTVVLTPLSKLLVKPLAGSGGGGSRTTSPKALATKYQLTQNLYRIFVPADSSLVGRTLQELEITQRYNISIVEIMRKADEAKPFSRNTIQFPQRDSVLHSGDTLYLIGSSKQVLKFIEENQLDLVSGDSADGSIGDLLDSVRFDEFGIAELVLLSNSKLINVTVGNSQFRERYGINILCIQRKNQFILQNLKDEKMQAGDVLLIQGEWNKIAALATESSEWVVVGQPLEEASKLPLSQKAPVAGGILIAMVIGLVANVIPAVITILLAALLMVLTGCFRTADEAYKTINWESVVLIATMLPMSVAIEKTGGISLFAGYFATGFGAHGPMVLLAAIYAAASLMTFFISNTAVAVLLAPIALQSSAEIGVSSLPFLFAVTVGASMCFASPFSTPPNALVMSAGRYTFMDYVRVGLPLQVIFGIVMVFVLPLIFGFDLSN